MESLQTTYTVPSVFWGTRASDGDDFSALTRAVSDFAGQATPLVGTVSGLARFAPSESSEGKVPVVALVNARGIQRLREALVQHLAVYGYHSRADFEYRLIASTERKTTISFHQEKLDNSEVREEMKRHWEEVLSSIDSLLS